MTDRLEGVGITPRELVPDTIVMVPVGEIPALVNGHPCVIAWAVVIGPVTTDTDPADPKGRWWLNVYQGGGVLPQMYPAEKILGVPAIGLTMNGAPPPTIVVRDS